MIQNPFVVCWKFSSHTTKAYEVYRPLSLKNEEGHFQETFNEKQNLSFNADIAHMFSSLLLLM